MSNVAAFAMALCFVAVLGCAEGSGIIPATVQADAPSARAAEEAPGSPTPAATATATLMTPTVDVRTSNIDSHTPVPTYTAAPTEVPAQAPTPGPSPSATPTQTPKPSPSQTPSPTTPLPPATQSPTPSPAPSPAPSPTPTTTPIATPAITGRPDVRITEVFYDGEEPRYEGDEYVEIANCGSAAQELEGWVLLDADDGGPSFVFPAYTLHDGYSVRVYTDEVHPDFGGFTFGSGTAIWNNSDPDLAELRNADGVPVSRRGYEPWSGCG